MGPLRLPAPTLSRLTKPCANISPPIMIPARALGTSKPATSARLLRRAVWSRPGSRSSDRGIFPTGLAARLHSAESLSQPKPQSNPDTRKDNKMNPTQTSKPGGMPRFIYALVVCALIAAVGVRSGIAADKGPKATVVFDHALPNVPGKSIKGVLVEYGPGGTSSAHTHPKSAFIYPTVLEGAIRRSVSDD